MSMSKYLQIALLKAHKLYTFCIVGLVLVVHQQSVQYYTGNTYSIAHMHYLLTYIAFLQEHTECIMLST